MNYHYDIYNGAVRVKSPMKKYVIGVIVSLLLAVGITASVRAAGNDQSGFTVGDCMSDVLYGNEPNMADGTLGGPAEQEPGTQAGNVLPTQSPGPFVNNPTDPDNPTRGRSAGQWMQEGVNVPEACRTAAAAL